MSAIKFIQGVARKSLTKNQGSGITTIPGAMQSESKAAEIVALLQQAGIPMNQLDDFIRSEADVLKFLNIIEAASKPRVIPGTSAEGKAITEKLFGKKGEVVEFPQKTSFKEQVEAMKKSGDIVNPNNLKKNNKVLTRELFRDSTLNKEPVNEKFIKYTIQDINKKDPIEGMKIANKIIKREGPFKDLTEAQSQKILKETDDHLTGKDIDYDPEDFYATGGRAGHYTGGIVDVEPSLDDIGHGSDALMARTRLVSPGNQATTSTGLNYLLAEDNDNMRVPFKDGLKVYPKIMASKSKQGLGNGKNVDLQDLTYGGTLMYDQGPFSAGIEYLKGKDKFDFKDKDTTLFKDTTDRELANLILMMKLKNGSIKFKGNKDNQMINLSKSFAQGGRIGFANGNGVADEDAEKAALGKRVRELMDEGFDMGEAVKKAMSEGYAEGGRIGFAGGGMGRRAFLKLLASIGGGVAAAKSGILGLGKGGGKKAVTETVKQAAGSGGQVPPYFLNLVKKIKTMGDDVTEVLAYKDKQKVTKYKDYELTEDLTTGEQTIQRMKVLDDGSEAYYGQPLTEETYMSYKPGKGQADETMKGKTPPDEYEEGTALLRSDRQYAGEVVDESATISDDVIKEGTVFEDTLSEFGKADGGRIGFSGGGIFRAIIAKSAAKKGMSVTDFIKATNYKGLPPEVRMHISADEFAKLKGGQKEIYDNFIDMAKTRKAFQENVEGGKTTPARSIFEQMEKTMDEQSFVPKTVTSDDIAQMELMVKNRFNKGRKDNAQGGLQTMLGE